MMTLQFYTRKDCALCYSALAVVHRVQRNVVFEVEVIDIDKDPALRALYGEVIPVVKYKNVELARSFFDEKKLKEAIRNLYAKS